MKKLRGINLFFEVIIIGCLISSFCLPWVEIVIYGELYGQKVMRVLKFNPIWTTSSKFYHSEFFFPIDPIYFVSFNIYGLVAGLIIYLIGCFVYFSHFILEEIKLKKYSLIFSSILLLAGSLIWLLGGVFFPFLIDFPNNPTTKFLLYNFELQSGFYLSILSAILISLYCCNLNIQDKFLIEFNPKLKEISLKFYESSNELFQKQFITNRKLVLQEHKSIVDLIKLGYWKDACIKMGSILEYLLTKWLENKNINRINHSKISNSKSLTKATFFDKMCYYLETAGSNFSFEIGKDTEWGIAQNIFRDYRNYIHLQEYEKRISNIGLLDEDSFSILEPAFKAIVKYF